MLSTLKSSTFFLFTCIINFSNPAVMFSQTFWSRKTVQRKFVDGSMPGTKQSKLGESYFQNNFVYNKKQ